MIGIIDYGAGNLQSVHNALKYLNVEHKIVSDAEEIRACGGLILPGVGAFAAAMDIMAERKLVDVIKESALSGKPFLGICLGMQLLFEESEESPGAKGLAVLPGRVKLLPDKGLKIPHMGWNSIKKKESSKILADVAQDSYFYFVHSYCVDAADESDVAAVTEYGTNFHSAVEHGNLFGTQFHPEKSGEAGLSILRKFSRLCGGDD